MPKIGREHFSRSRKGGEKYKGSNTHPFLRLTPLYKDKEHMAKISLAFLGSFLYIDQRKEKTKEKRRKSEEKRDKSKTNSKIANELLLDICKDLNKIYQ